MEERVLSGFGQMLERQAIDVVQFEYGRASILSHFLLRDYHEFFTRRGYVVGRVFPNHVEFREYELGDESFLGGNYLACRRDLGRTIQALGDQGAA